MAPSPPRFDFCVSALDNADFLQALVKAGQRRCERFGGPATEQARLDQEIYRKGRKVTERQLKELALSTHDTCPRWNYTLTPKAHSLSATLFSSAAVSGPQVKW
ncbi:MAG: hypothetical protein E6G80_19750 [Alphaproteobacteria bacterium]|nr:MAG: hypothetical protein E6G80_19750 [Alphaproteobacteria bacterium]